jgi:HEAT repeat protein
MPSPAPRAATSKLASLTAAATDQNATPASRAQAFLGLAEQGSKAAPALSAIQGALDDESREVRDAATEALIKCCPAEALRHANPRIRQRAVSELALDPQVPGVLEALVQPALTDPDKWVRTSAVNALAKTGPRAAALLGERLTRKDPDYKRALQVLVVIGPQAFKALEDAQKKAQAANDEALAKEIARAIGELSTSRR